MQGSYHLVFTQRLPHPSEKYHENSNIKSTLVGIEIGASPAGAAQTTFSFSTYHLASIYNIKTIATQGEKHRSSGIWCVLYWRFDSKLNWQTGTYKDAILEFCWIWYPPWSRFHKPLIAANSTANYQLALMFRITKKRDSIVPKNSSLYGNVTLRTHFPHYQLFLRGIDQCSVWMSTSLKEYIH